MIPFAVANAPADTKFLTCVTGDKIVLAICDVALGYKTKLSYILPKVPDPAIFKPVSSNASATAVLAK